MLLMSTITRTYGNVLILGQWDAVNIKVVVAVSMLLVLTLYHYYNTFPTNMDWGRQYDKVCLL